MSNIFLWIFLFIIGYLIIFFSADIFLDNLKELCIIYGASPFIIGMVILGIDPEESIASIIAAMNGLPYVAMGNVIGNSLIALTISFALPSFFYKIDFKSIPQFYFNLLYFYLTIILIGFLIFYGLFIVGVITLFLYFIYLHRNIKQIFKDNIGIEKLNDQEVLKEEDKLFDLQKESKIKKIILIIISFLFIFLGGELLIYSARQILLKTNISEAFFGFIIIAFVTNVEELTLVIKAIKKHSIEISLGAMIGKIFWNLSITFGISAIIIINIQFISILFWNWFLLLVLFIYFNWISKKEYLVWKDGLILTLILFIFLSVNVITVITS
ncbi:MAG: sodium:calcium antiporter [Candidatus Odinarchaeota archaeon]